MRRLTLALRLFLALSVALVSVHTAVGRAEAAAAQEIQLCAGPEVVTVTLDASGKPVEHRHACPDCVLAGLATSPVSALPHPPAVKVLRLSRPDPAAQTRAILAPTPVARGPPVACSA